MWSFPIDKNSTENSIPVAATKVEPTACEKQCASHQKTLVACVDSIRAARSDDDGGASSGSGNGSSAADANACLPMAVAAWTKCCEEANLREDAKASSS